VEFVVCQYARTLKKKKQMEINIKENLSKGLESSVYKLIYEMIGRESVLEETNNQLIMGAQNNNRRIEGLSEIAKSIINQQNFGFLLAPKGSQFITSDDPAFFIENSNFVIPLSSDICMITGLQGDEYTTGTITKEEVNRINRDTARNASIVIVAKEKSILKEIVSKLSL
jgi:hypothetical protein